MISKFLIITYKDSDENWIVEGDGIGVDVVVGDDDDGDGDKVLMKSAPRGKD